MTLRKTWNDNLNDVIRDVIFPDETLLDMMIIPNNLRDDIITFITKYFIKDPSTDEVVTNENVRICYYTDNADEIGMNVNRRYIYFDIYVKNEELHTYSNDMLASRTELIADRLRELLTQNRYICNLRFKYVDDYDLYTKQIGYRRYCVCFSYNASY